MEVRRFLCIYPLLSVSFTYYYFEFRVLAHVLVSGGCHGLNYFHCMLIRYRQTPGIMHLFFNERMNAPHNVAIVEQQLGHRDNTDCDAFSLEGSCSSISWEQHEVART